jgi:hypothetical protein
VSESKVIGRWLIAIIPIVCCLGVPLMLAAGLGVAALALIGGITVGAVALAAAIGFFLLRAGGSRGSARRILGDIARRSS